MPDRDVQVAFQVAQDPQFRRIVRRGEAQARARLGHSVHVDADRLEPGTEYYYRFRAGSYLSPVGRARTTAAPGRSLRAALRHRQLPGFPERLLAGLRRDG
jgi:alkaline phosphatase D